MLSRGSKWCHYLVGRTACWPPDCGRRSRSDSGWWQQQPRWWRFVGAKMTELWEEFHCGVLHSWEDRTRQILVLHCGKDRTCCKIINISLLFCHESNSNVTNCTWTSCSSWDWSDCHCCCWSCVSWTEGTLLLWQICPDNWARCLHAAQWKLN